MRVQLAFSILNNTELIVFDEYTSVVDRNVAKIGSAAIQKAIRKNNKQFIAVACHYDILGWLEPDWVFDTKEMKMVETNFTDQKQKLTYTNKRVNGTYFANIII